MPPFFRHNNSSVATVLNLQLLFSNTERLLNFNYIYRFYLNFRRPLSPARGPSRKTKTFEEREQEVKDFMKLTPEQITENEKKIWTRSAPADLYYNRDSTNPIVMHSTERYVTNSFSHR